MKKDNISIYGPNLVCCCIDSNEQGTLQGRLYCGGKKQAVFFPDIHQILFSMEKYFDEIRFPMASTESRSFSDNKPAKLAERGGKLMHDRSLSKHKGKKSTFIVQVQYRQNATWQGKIIWTEENKVQYFRSALEMLKLIDSTFESESDAFDQGESNTINGQNIS